MRDRNNTHKETINGTAGAGGPEELDGVEDPGRADGADESLDSEAAALLGASLRPVAPPARIRSALMEAIAHEPRTGVGAGAAADCVPATDSTGGGAADSVVSLDAHRRRRSAWRTALVRGAAAVVLLGVGVGVGRWSTRGAVDEAMDSMAPTQHYAHLNQAQDVQRVTDTMSDGHVATLTWSRDMSMTALTLPAAMKESAGDRGLQVWLKEGDRTTSLGVYDPRGGAGFSFLDIMPEPGQEIVITQEPAGGSSQPTTPPLVTLRVGENASRPGTVTGSPAPEPSASPGGDSA